MKNNHPEHRRQDSIKTRLLHLLVGLLIISAAPLAFAAATFQGIGFFPGGSWSSAYRVSGDGNTVVGDAQNADGMQEAIRWTAAGGLQGLGYLQGGAFSTAYGVSADGTVIAGDADEGTGNSPGFRWTQAGGMAALGLLPDSLGNSIYDMSEDGKAILGYDGSTGLPFRWTPATGPVILGTPPTGYTSVYGIRISADGSVVVGDLYSESGFQEAFRWTSTTGFVGLGILPNGGYSSAWGVSRDGSAITGDADDENYSVGFYWTATGGMIPLGPTYNSPWYLSADGKVVVGANDAGTMGTMRWTLGGGSRDLYDLLTKIYGLNLTGWYLYNAEAVSADGSVIVGTGTNPDGMSEGWRAFIPPQVPAAGRVLVEGLFDTTFTWTPQVFDPEGDPLTCRLMNPPANGTATVKSDCVSGTYKPKAGFVGLDSFSYVANDGKQDSNTAMVEVAVLAELPPSPTPTPTFTVMPTPTPIPPVLRNITLHPGLDSTVTWVPGFSADGLTGCSIVNPPLYGTATIAADCRSGTYTPGANYAGQDSFTYIGSYYGTTVNMATVTISNLTADSLPNGSQLRLTAGSGSMPNVQCNTGSCFGMVVAPGFNVWTDMAPGTAAGIVVGRDQKSGGQELAPSAANTTSGAITAAWYFFGNYGTFFTTPGSSANIFSMTPCIGSSCIGKTELGIWHTAWNGNNIPMGSANGCSHPNCTVDERQGIHVSQWNISLGADNTGPFTLVYDQVVPRGGFTGVPYRLIMRGTAIHGGSIPPTPPIAYNVSAAVLSGNTVIWKPNAVDYDGDPITCFIGAMPAHGTATVNADCSSGTYMSNVGYAGADSFTYGANDGTSNGNLATVSINVLPLPTPIPTPLPNPTAGDLTLRLGTNPSTAWTPVVRDPQNDRLTCRIVASPSFGTATVASDCTAGTYTPGANFAGNDNFTYAANDGTYDSNVAKVTVTNLPPSALPNISQLTIKRGIGSAPNLSCASGSCFGMEVAPGFVIWTDFGPGTDGGIIVGKEQKSGGQELAPSSSNTTSGELTDAFLFFGNYGTFSTAGGAAANLFDSGSCTGAGCVGVTELGTWNFAWNSNILPVGSLYGCRYSACTTDQQNGIFIKRWLITLDPSGTGTYRLEYGTVLPTSGFSGVKFSLILDGQVSTGPLSNLPPYARDMSLSTPINAPVNWVPAVTDVNHDPLTCSITNPPLNGTVTVAPDCSGGTYTPKAGFVGFDSFKYKANDGSFDSNLGTVSVAIGQPTPTFTATYTATFTPTSTATGTPSRTPTYTATYTATVTARGTSTNTFTGTPAATATATATFTPYFNVTPSPGGLLPAGTKLGIMPGLGSMPNVSCSSGSCFGMEVAPGFVVWTDFGPGTDGGFIVGKAQKSGGQDTGPSAATNTPGELTSAWVFFGNYGTFHTTPGGETNWFDDANCSLSDCVGKTELRVFNVAWNGAIIPMGTAAWGCAYSPSYCINQYLVDTGNFSWSLNYRQVVPSGGFVGVKFQLFVRGSVTPATTPNSPPMASNITLWGIYGVTIGWTPAVADPNGDVLTCRIGTPPGNGVATVASNCSSGTYRADVGFVGTDAFTYIANDGKTDSNPGYVNVAASAPSTIPTPTFTATPTPAGCAGTYPVKQISQTGKDGTLTVTFTGNIISYTKKQMKICPSTRLDYKAVSTKGAVVCKIKNNTAPSSGMLKVRDHLKCSDKPAGKDKVSVKVKSGVTG